MIVYVETNFILELAFEQEQHQAANEILKLAEHNKVEFALPGFSISESLSKVTRQIRKREELHKSLIPTLQDIGRSAPYQQFAASLEPVLQLLQNTIRDEPDRLLSVLERILKVGRLLELDISNFNLALAYKDQLSTSIEDSIVYGTIIADLRRRPYEGTKLFLSRDAEAFSYQRIKTELASYSCKYIKEFKDGLGYIESELRKAE
ncbi:MAG: PIN domain-containing protein [Ktedonobacteraceae bacterium]